MNRRPIRSIKEHDLPGAIEASPVCQNWIQAGINPDDLLEGLKWLQADPMDGLASGLTRELFAIATKTDYEGDRIVTKESRLVKAGRTHTRTGGVVFYRIDDDGKGYNRQIDHSNRSVSLNALDKI